MTKNRVYCKTDKGRQEIIERRHPLTFRQRNTLILMDCAKKLELIADAIPLTELEKTVPFLLEHGFIVLAHVQQAEERPVAARDRQTPAGAANTAAATLFKQTSTQPPLTQDTDIIEKVKAFMLASTDTHLGLMGADTIARIQRCRTAEQLIAAAAFWHMALRESRTGKEFAAIFMEQVKFELRSGN
ncbi:MAG TPA: hypothetical protein VFN66_01630 [Burkholderiales bacterium]|nr:hypothetical protein [Burkholderiales bacterium]